MKTEAGGLSLTLEDMIMDSSPPLKRHVLIGLWGPRKPSSPSFIPPLIGNGDALWKKWTWDSPKRRLET